MAFKTIVGALRIWRFEALGFILRRASQGALRVMLEVCNAVPGLRSSGEELNSGHL